MGIPRQGALPQCHSIVLTFASFPFIWASPPAVGYGNPSHCTICPGDFRIKLSAEIRRRNMADRHWHGDTPGDMVQVTGLSGPGDTASMTKTYSRQTRTARPGQQPRPSRPPRQAPCARAPGYQGISLSTARGRRGAPPCRAARAKPRPAA